MTAQRIADIALTSVGVSAKTNWLFLELTLDDGRIGTGDATRHGSGPRVGLCSQVRIRIGSISDQMPTGLGRHLALRRIT